MARIDSSSELLPPDSTKWKIAGVSGMDIEADESKFFRGSSTSDNPVERALGNMDINC